MTGGEMSLGFILSVAAGAAAGGFINGLAGFGTALFALGFFLNVMTPVQAVAVVVVLSVASGLQGLWLVRYTIKANMRRLTRFLAPGILGIPLGVLTLSFIGAGTLKFLVGAFLILYGGYFSIRSTLPTIDRHMPQVDMAVGFAGGVLGGAASLSGALPTMWCSLRDWSKNETRAVLQPFNVVVLGLTAVSLALRGVYTGPVIWALVIAIPTAMIAAQGGILLFRRLSDDQFRRLLIGMCLLSGTILMLRGLL